MTNRYAVGFALVALGAFCVGGDAAAAGAIDYPDFISGANYPAHVKAVHFDNCAIDAQHSCTWGAWTVSFGPTAPVANFTNNGIAQVGVTGLTCTNSVIGSSSCGASYTPQVCSQGLTANLAPIFISCPTSIELAP